MIRKLLFLWLQFDGKMRPGDRLPEEDFGPVPSLSEYFFYLGIGVACILLMCLISKIQEKVEDKSKVLSAALVVLGLAALFGSWYCLLPLLAIWYTWAFVVGAIVLFLIVYSIWDKKRKTNYQKEQEIENRKWERLASFDIFPSSEKPDITKKPLKYMLQGWLECKTENGNKCLFINRKYPIEYNPFYQDASVGEWGTFQFRYSYYIDSYHKKNLSYMYFNLPDDVISLVDIEQRFTKSKEPELGKNRGIIVDDLPF